MVFLTDPLPIRLLLTMSLPNNNLKDVTIRSINDLSFEKSKSDPLYLKDAL
jgi:hypothetical protein